MKHISSKVSLLLMCLLLVGGAAQAEKYKGAVKQKPTKKAELESGSPEGRKQVGGKQTGNAEADRGGHRRPVRQQL